MCFLPVLAYVCSLFAAAEGAGGWLSTTAFAAGLTGITVKLLTGAPVIALQHVAVGTPLQTALDDVASASSVASLYPLTVLLAAVATLTFRTRVLPRWLGFGAAAAAIGAAGYAVYGTVHVHVNSGPALLLWALWTLVTSVVLLRKTRVEPAPVAETYSAIACLNATKKTQPVRRGPLVRASSRVSSR